MELNMPAAPKLVNRGPAGLLNKTKRVEPPAAPVEVKKEQTFLEKLLAKHPDAAVAKIAPAIASLAVPTDVLVPDPNNARRHPERNMEAIMASLAEHGQVKPIVVREQGMIVMAGNGTMEAAKRLGWKEIAASVVEMDDVQAASYGLADNRTAELATWDFATVSRLERLIAEAGGEMVGWSDDELAALRTVDFSPPEDFPEVDESIEVEHVCPKCGYAFSGGEVVAKE